MSLNLPICHACNTTLSRKQRTYITENVTNRPYLGAQLKKCDQMCHFLLTKVSATNIKAGTFFSCIHFNRICAQNKILRQSLVPCTY